MKRKNYFNVSTLAKSEEGCTFSVYVPGRKKKRKRRVREASFQKNMPSPPQSGGAPHWPLTHSLFPLPRPTLSRSNCLGSRTEPPSPPHPRPTSRLSSVPRIPVHEIQRKEEKKEPLPPSSSGVRFVWQRVGLRSAGRSAKMPRQMEGRRRMGEVSSEERQKKEWRRRRKGVEIRATLRPEGKRVKEEERRKEGKA